MKDDRARLLDILEAIERVEKVSAQGRSDFDRDPLIQVWIVHHLQIVGEAARQLSTEFTHEHSEIPWAQIISMRNILVHNYFGIDLEEVWSAVEKDIPDLQRKVTRIVEGWEEG
jgi:uncharacterized protein with HEPN domain